MNCSQAASTPSVLPQFSLVNTEHSSSYSILKKYEKSLQWGLRGAPGDVQAAVANCWNQFWRWGDAVLASCTSCIRTLLNPGQSNQCEDPQDIQWAGQCGAWEETRIWHFRCRKHNWWSKQFTKWMYERVLQRYMIFKLYKKNKQ